MIQRLTTGLVLAAALAVLAAPLPAAAGIFTPKGGSKAEKQAAIRKDRDEILAMLYKERPETRAKIAKSAGYATFSNVNINLLVLAAGTGYGMVTDRRSGRTTYMSMGTVGGGFGLGAKDLRAVFIFRDADVLKEFTDKGWQFAAEASGAAKAGEKGGAIAREGGVDTGANAFEIYQLTKNGIALQATLAGTKYWKNKDLN